jgi:hypothetical protein
MSLFAAKIFQLYDVKFKRSSYLSLVNRYTINQWEMSNTEIPEQLFLYLAIL